MGTRKSNYRYEADGSFAISDYNFTSPFSSFLPGIAGPWGVPMWVFFVNRGQGVCSFGLRDKDHSILEFLSANWAYQLVYTQGFRTFMRVGKGRKSIYYEPFQVASPQAPQFSQTMKTRPHEVAYIDTNRSLGLETRVDYFTLPEEPIAALVRTLTIKNRSKSPISLQILDGLPMIVPFGLNNYMLKSMRYLAQSYPIVSGLKTRTPGFQMKVKSDDSALVEEVDRFNFCFGFEASGRRTLLEPVVESKVVFGGSTDYQYPQRFIEAPAFKVPSSQAIENQLPSAFLHAKRTLKPDEEVTYNMFYGNALNEEDLATFARRSRTKGYVDAKREENRLLGDRLTQPCATVSSHPVFNAYARQNLLDNVLRGGAPTTLSQSDNPVVLSLYSRKHGDLERDYNWYIVEPTQLSQGESNYRDVNQNRRHDVFFNPDVDDEAVVNFFNLLQPDGYNPLIVEPKKFVCSKTQPLRTYLSKAAGKTGGKLLYEQVTKEFEPGHLLLFVKDHGIPLKVADKELIEYLLEHAQSVQESRFGMGFWVDHWTYNLDLLDSFRGIFPERYTDLLFRNKRFIYCDTHGWVKPRSEKYLLVNGRPMQLESVGEDPRKEALISGRTSHRHAVRTENGKGEVYYTTLACKLLTLALVKFASLDAHGAGVEMDAERPGWNDALNGLPGQFGSSTCELFELKRLLKVVDEALALMPKGTKWLVPIEFGRLFDELNKLLSRHVPDASQRTNFNFWNQATTAKERFRKDTRDGFTGYERALKPAEIRAFVERALVKVEAGIHKAVDKKTGLYHTYYRFEVAAHKTGPKVDGHQTFRPTGFRRKTLPPYLEGQVHALRVERDTNAARKLVHAVKKSGLYDNDLKMYMVNASLDGESQDIGRARTFARGWLENESVWLHMEYKYLLEILRSGLAKEFFEEFRHCGIPFLEPEVYGRSTTENSSFIVSHVHPNKDVVGKGFMARLSGATAEFVHMWLFMCVGERPFRIGDDGRLLATFEPTLPAWLFTRKATRLKMDADGGQVRSYRVPAKSFAFAFMGETAVIYTHKGRVRDTFGRHGAKVDSIQLDYGKGRTVEMDGDQIPEEHARALRNREIAAVRVGLR